MRRAAPPAAWAVALALISPLLYATAEVTQVATHGAQWTADAEVSKRIQAFFAEPAPATTRRGVMLGLSGGLCAFAGAPAGGPVQVLPVAAVGQGFHELYPYLDEVIAQQPAFILIQGTALVTTAAPPSAYEVIRRRLRRRLLWPLLGGNGESLEGAVAGAGRDACRSYATAQVGAADLTTEIAWVTRDPGVSARRRLLSALESLLESHIPLYVFDQPRNRVLGRLPRGRGSTSRPAAGQPR